MKLKRFFSILFLIALIVGTVFILRRHSTVVLQSSKGLIFGTTYDISYVYNAPLDSQIRRELLAVDQSLSMFNTTSTVSRLNDGTSDQTDARFRQVFTIAQAVATETGGAYDVTVAPLVNLWGFGFQHRSTVTPQRVDSVRSFVGYEKVKLEGTRLVKADSRVTLDFSSVAKGYGVDCVARLFDSLGIDNYMICIGGEVVVKGQHPKGRPWEIGINKPTTDEEASPLQTVLFVRNAAIATSGNYRRFYEQDGQRYAHTIDPHTGYPVQHNLLSATIIAPTCATADAYATACMVLGMERAKQLLSKHPELSAYFIYAAPNGQYATWANTSMQQYFKK